MPTPIKTRATNTARRIQWDQTLLVLEPLALYKIKTLSANMRPPNQVKIEEASFRLGKPKSGSKSGLTTPQSMVWDTISRMMWLAFSSTTQQRSFLIQMDIILITWREDLVIVKMSARSTLWQSIRRSFKRRLLSFSTSGATLKVMTNPKPFLRKTTLKHQRQEKSKMLCTSRNGWGPVMPSCSVFQTRLSR